MNGLEAVELRLHDVIMEENPTFRLDSEFVKKEYLENLYRIKQSTAGYTVLTSIIKEITGGATPLGAEYFSNGIRFLRVQNIMPNYFHLDDLVYISNEDDVVLKRSRLKENDVLLTITGVSYGKSAVVPKQLVNANINQHSVKIELKEKSFNPYFLSTFLNCKFGKLQSDKNITGVTRPALDYQAIRRFLVSNASDSFQLEIQKIILNSYEITANEKETYLQAQNLLIKELGLKDWKPNPSNKEVKSFQTSFLKTGRLDSEYYQPKYDEFFKLLQSTCAAKSWEITNLGSLSEPLKYGSSNPYEYQDSGVPFLRIADLSNYEFDKNDIKYICTEDANNEQASSKVKTNDILISRSGSLGLTVPIIKEYEGSVYGSYFIRFRPNDKELNLTYIALYMNSLAGRIQVEQISTGGIQTNLTIPAIENFKIVLPGKELQDEIEAIVLESKKLRKQSENLLFIAKQAVEIAIEQSEAAAIEFLKMSN